MTHSTTVTIIEAKQPHPLSMVREAWARRELWWMLVLRELQVRYRQTLLGIAWAILQPVAIMSLFWVAFGVAAKIDHQSSVPYPLFVLAGLVPWQLFVYSLTHGANSLVDNERMITKVYFPRILLPLASVSAAVVDCLIAFVLLLILQIVIGHPPGLSALIAPLGLAICLLASAGLALLLSALNVRFRDVRYTLPLLLQAGLLASPVAYPSSLLPAHIRWLFDLNPMAGGIEVFRSAMLGLPFDLRQAAISVLIAIGLFVVGSRYFTANERIFADRI